MFFRGQKVTMKHDDAHWEPVEADVINPEFGVVYTVRAIDFIEGREWLQFVEIVNAKVPYHGGHEEPWFEGDAFRPVVERKTDISVFKALLEPASRMEDV